ncbi:MinD/ParA family ATP-binding protein [Marinobacter caseinilyticus]|uniref:MinD/ParA family ATP-binding protein n=1 Tax=Marinobacter caseinilyticus TaxID=2692195 RepID=UPI00140976C0|nr:AAA family ATPase [Marinobacter caseinilyticus]
MTVSKQVSRQPKILAVTGGKGGVGKTSVALNLALTLAREGHGVLLLDGDTDLANIAIMLGRHPRHTLAQVLEGQCTLADIIMEAPFDLHIIPGASGVQRCMEIGVAGSFDLLRGLADLERQYDYILIDTAAGLQPAVLHMIAAAAMACVVVTPEPTSLTDAFSLIKVLQRHGYRRTPSVLVNMAQGASQARSVFQRFAAALQRYLGVSPHYLGAIWRDETLRQSVTNQRPVALLAESDPSCRQFRILADMVRVRLDQLPPRKAGIAAYWYRLARKADQSAKASEPEAVPDTTTQVHQLVSCLGDLLGEPSASPMLRYEAFTACFALLGRTMDDDTIEIVQTGLAALDWESLTEPQRQRFASHLHHLAEQMVPAVPQPESLAVANQNDGEPRYDQVIFGDQARLLRALQEQPADMSLDRFLQALADNSGRQK